MTSRKNEVLGLIIELLSVSAYIFLFFVLILLFI